MTIASRSVTAACAFLIVSSLGMAQKATSSESEVKVVDLGTLGGSSSQANAVGLRGAIAGSASLSGDTAQHAFLRTPGNSTLQDLGTLYGGVNSAATGVNAFQQVTGYSDFDDPANGVVTHGFFYSKGVLRDVGTLGGAIAQANGLDNSGYAVGFSLLSDEATTHAFLYNPFKNSITDLGVLAGGSNSAAYAINDLGLAAGSSETGAVDAGGSPIVDAVLFNPWKKTVVDLGNLGASPAQATAINNFSGVVGFSAVPDGTYHGFYWNSGSFTDLGTLGGSYTQATGISDRGVVVGFSNITGDTDVHAFLWTKKKGIVDLNTLLPAGSGWELNSAYGINSRGEIVGAGLFNGESHAFSLKLTDN